MEVISNVNAQRSGVRSIVWLGPGAEKQCDLSNGSLPFANALAVLTSRSPRTDLARCARNEIPLLDIATLTGTIDDPSCSSSVEGDCWLLAGEKATKLHSPLGGHAANRLATPRVTGEKLGEPSNGDATEALSVAAANRRREKLNREHTGGPNENKMSDGGRDRASLVS